MQAYTSAPDQLFANLPELVTPRLRLRRLTLEDAEDMFAYASDPEVARYTSWEPHISIDDSRAVLARAIDAYRSAEVAHWGIEHRVHGQLIGTCGFKWWNTDYQSAEVNYYLSRDYWNQGLMTEAIEEVIGFGFDVMGLNRIEAQCEPPNVGSAKVMEKVGMSYEGMHRQAVFDKGSSHDLKVYAVLRQDRRTPTRFRLIPSDWTDWTGTHDPVSAQS